MFACNQWQVDSFGEGKHKQASADINVYRSLLIYMFVGTVVSFIGDVNKNPASQRQKNKRKLPANSF